MIITPLKMTQGFICIVESVLVCMGRHRFPSDASTSTIRRTSHRLLNGRQTSYSEVFYCHNCASRRNSGNVENGSCHHFRQPVDPAAASDSFGKSPNQARVRASSFTLFHFRSANKTFMWPHT